LPKETIIKMKKYIKKKEKQGKLKKGQQKKQTSKPRNISKQKNQ
jgi:hypothetical protein